MTTTLYGLTVQQVERLKRVLDMVDRGQLTLPNPQPRRDMLYADRGVMGFLDAAVAGTSSLNGTPTVGTLSVYTFSSTGTADTNRDETVYNFAPTDATTDRWTVCHRDDPTGKLVIHTQYCS